MLTPPPNYYIYYNPSTGTIHSVTTNPPTSNDTVLKIDADVYANLVSGKWHFEDYYVGKRLSVPTLKKIVTEYVKKKRLHWVEIKDKSEVIVEWDVGNKRWNFSLDSVCKDFIISNSTDELFDIVFFIVKESDQNQIIRTIQVPVEELINTDKVSVEFENKIEFDIADVNISATSINNFESYGLIINE
jgi:hypothetical protein